MTAVPALPYAGTLTDVQGIEVGHFTDPRRPTGCSVVLARAGHDANTNPYQEQPPVS